MTFIRWKLFHRFKRSFMTVELETMLHIKEKRLNPHISNRHKLRHTNFNMLQIFRIGLDWKRMNQARIKQNPGCISVGNPASNIRIQLHRDMFSSLERLKKLSSLHPDDGLLHSSNSDVTVHMFLGLLMLGTKSVTINSIKRVPWRLEVIGVCWQHSMTTLSCTKQHRDVRKNRCYNSVENMHHIILK